MKTYIVILILFPILTICQPNNEKKIELNKFADSIDNLIHNSLVTPEGIYSNAISTIRNIRAIGVQETKITFYYFQKDDSVYEGNEKIVYFIPRYNPPLKILVEYNIAVSQRVNISYYIDDEKYAYKFSSTGAYSNNYKAFWINDGELLRYEEKYQDTLNAKVESGKFSKEVYSDGLLIIERIKTYLKLYYDILNIEYIDK